MNNDEKITMKHIWEARKRIIPFVQETPLIESPSLGHGKSANVMLKLENMHETGAFKLRGATNKLLSLTEEEKRRGVTTFSTGNHGLAVATIAKRLGVKAVICISNRVPDAKVKRLERLGAEVMKVGNNQDDAEAYAYDLEQREGLTVIHPFDDPHIIAGQGTIGIELMNQAPSLDMVIIPVSGGGLFSGISYVLKQYNPNIHIIGVSMGRSAVMYESIQAGEIVSLQEEDTLADSLLGGIGLDNQYTYKMVQQYIDEFILLTEDEIASGMAFMMDEHQFAVEGAAATSVGAILHDKIDIRNKSVAGIITGKNVDSSVILQVCNNLLL